MEIARQKNTSDGSIAAPERTYLSEWEYRVAERLAICTEGKRPATEQEIQMAEREADAVLHKIINQ